MPVIVNTEHGDMTIETAVPLADLSAGDVVLGYPVPDRPRSVYRVVAGLGEYATPSVFAFSDDRTQQGILVAPATGSTGDASAMFSLERAPVLDRVIGGLS